MGLDRSKKEKILQKIVITLVALATIFVFDFWLFSPREFFGSKPGQESADPNLPTNAEPTIGPDYQDFSPLSVKKTKREQNKANEQSTETLDIKPEVNLTVPFTVQAPFAKWDDLHNEACEEAALIMAKYWLSGRDLTLEASEQEILAAVQWQEQAFGGHYDLNVSDVVRLGNQYFGLGKIYFTSIENINDIKYQLSQGNLVLTPMAGRLLNNPYFRRPGPAYHMVVVKGYNSEEIITNDPGTKRGANFAYSNDIFFQAIYDWPYSPGEMTDLDQDAKAEEILKGQRAMIVVEKE